MSVLSRKGQNVDFQNNGPKLAANVSKYIIVKNIKYAVFTYDQDLDTLNARELKGTCKKNDVQQVITIDKVRLYTSADCDFLEDNQLAIALMELAEEGTYTVTLPTGLVEAFGACNNKDEVSFVYRDGSVNVIADEVKYDGTSLYVSFLNKNTGDPAKMGDSALNQYNYQIEGKFVFKKAVFNNCDNTEVKLTLNNEVIQYDNEYLFEISNIKDSNGYLIKDYRQYIDFNPFNFN
ncbi:MAG: hypothetical protein PHV56_04025 [Clostridia bacterium]|nr:hypothetical protein [Clostridia bacterium]